MGFATLLTTSGKPTFSVTVGRSSDCDYVCSGTSGTGGDDQQIQYAINAVGVAGGGAVFIRNGEYFLSARIHIGYNNVKLVAESHGTILTAINDYGDIFTAWPGVGDAPDTQPAWPGLTGLDVGEFTMRTLENRVKDKDGNAIPANSAARSVYVKIHQGSTDYGAWRWLSAKPGVQLLVGRACVSTMATYTANGIVVNYQDADGGDHSTFIQSLAGGEIVSIGSTSGANDLGHFTVQQVIDIGDGMSIIVSDDNVVDDFNTEHVYDDPASSDYIRSGAAFYIKWSHAAKFNGTWIGTGQYYSVGPQFANGVYLDKQDSCDLDMVASCNKIGVYASSGSNDGNGNAAFNYAGVMHGNPILFGPRQGNGSYLNGVTGSVGVYLDTTGGFMVNEANISNCQYGVKVLGGYAFQMQGGFAGDSCETGVHLEGVNRVTLLGAWGVSDADGAIEIISCNDVSVIGGTFTGTNSINVISCGNVSFMGTIASGAVTIDAACTAIALVGGFIPGLTYACPHNQIQIVGVIDQNTKLADPPTSPTGLPFGTLWLDTTSQLNLIRMVQ